MTTQKREYASSDAAPVILYAKTDVDATNAYPITAAMFNSGFAIPEYDEIELSYTVSDLTGVVYKLGGVTLATLALTYTSGNLTGVVKT